MRRELEPFAIQQLIDVVLNSPGDARILNVLIQAKHKMRDRWIVAQPLPPQSLRPGRAMSDGKLRRSRLRITDPLRHREGNYASAGACVA